jgi:hypothetical protein
MATSSNFSTTNQYIKYRVEMTINSQNLANNTSNVTVKVFFWRTNTGYTTAGAGTVYCTINGNNYTSAVTYAQKITSSGIYLFSKTLDIPHNADGTKTLNVSAYINHDTFSSSSQSASFKLTTIPRTSSVTCNSFFIGDSTTININRASASFTHTIKYVYGPLTGTIATKTTATSVGWTPPKADFYGQIPNGTTGYGSITCETYSGNTLIGTATTNFNAYAKENEAKPSVSATIVDTNEDTKKLTGDSTKLIKYLSKPKVTISASPKFSSTIKSRKVLWGDGVTSTSAETTFSDGVTSKNVVVSATDSRNYTTAVNYDLSNKWVEYVKLAFSRITLSRTESTLSTANIKVSGNYFNGSFGSVQNDFTLKYRYKINESGRNFTNYITVVPSRTNDTFDYSETLSNIDYKKEYIFEFVLEDEAMIVYSGEQVLEKGEAIFRIGEDYTRTNGRMLDQNGAEITNGLSKYRTGGVEIDPDTTLEELVLTEKNVPSGGFWYVRTMFYSTKTGTSNRTQVAYPYGNSVTRAGIYTRVYKNGTGWSEWKGIGLSNASGESVGNASLGELSIEWGKVTVTPVANTPTTQVVYFNKTYQQPPVVVVSASTGVIGTGVLGVAVAGVATNYATLVITRTNTVPTGIHFIVIGKVA